MVNKDFSNWVNGFFKIQNSSSWKTFDYQYAMNQIIKHYEMLLISYPEGIEPGSIAWQFKIFIELLYSKNINKNLVFEAYEFDYIEQVVQYYVNQKGWLEDERSIAYSIQGYLEITNCSILHSAQINLIADLIQNTSNSFLKKTKAVLTLVDNDEAIDGNMLDIIKNELGNYFLHEVDPTFGPDTIQEAMNAIHNTPVNWNSYEPDFEEYSNDGYIAKC